MTIFLGTGHFLTSSAGFTVLLIQLRNPDSVPAPRDGYSPLRTFGSPKSVATRLETTASYATVTPLLCVDDFNSPVVGIYNRDHYHGISFLYRRAGRHRGVFAAERTFGLSVHSKQEPFFFRSRLTLWLLGSGLVGWFRQYRSCKHPNLHGRNARDHAAMLPESSPRSRRRTPTDYGCFNGLSASNFPPRAIGPLAGIRNYVSTALVLAKNLQRTIFFRDTQVKFS